MEDTEMSERLDRLEAQIARLHLRPVPFWRTWMMEDNAEDLMPPGFSSIDLLRYFQAATMQFQRIFRILIASLYGVQTLSILGGTGGSNSLPLWVRGALVVFYLVVALGNLSCILLISKAHHLLVAYLTILAALITFLFRLATLSGPMPVQALISLLFWGGMVLIHIGGCRAIPGLVASWLFARRLIKNSEAHDGP